MVSSAPIAAIMLIVSLRKRAPRNIETMTASCEITPTVIASTQRRVNVSSSCAAIARSDVAINANHSSRSGDFHVAIANGDVTNTPKRQKPVYTAHEFSPRRAARMAGTRTAEETAIDEEVEALKRERGVAIARDEQGREETDREADHRDLRSREPRRGELRAECHQPEERRRREHQQERAPRGICYRHDAGD